MEASTTVVRHREIGVRIREIRIGVGRSRKTKVRTGERVVVDNLRVVVELEQPLSEALHLQEGETTVLTGRNRDVESKRSIPLPV